MDNSQLTLATKLVAVLIEKGLHITFAESCTGGKLSAAIVDVADASKVFDAGIITYANEAKMRYVGVKEESIEREGVVSELVAGEMAKGVALLNQAEIGVGVSGIAGPGGGTKDKPVGMVCFGYSILGNVTTETMYFGEIGRNEVRDASVMHVLSRLLDSLSDM